MISEMEKARNREKLQRLIQESFSEEDSEKRFGIAESILKLDPGNPVGKYVKWQEMDDDESMENMNLLYEAIDSMRSELKTYAVKIEGDNYSIFLSMLSDLSSFLYFRGEKDKAFEAAQELVDLDNECYTAGRIVYYSILVERGEYRRVLDAVEADICETPTGEYCRAIALYELDGPADDATDAVVQAISLDPDLAFFVTGIWMFDDEEMDASDEDSDDMDEIMMLSAVLSELWSASDERLAFLSAIVFAFGYLTGRVDCAEDISMLEDGYRNLGCLEEMREARDTIHALLADGKDHEEVDEEALLIFKDMREKGLF
jgi:tetratricopeptide (TPR) repeat protein